MATETKSLSARYRINSDLVLSVEELKDAYLFGIPIQNRNNVYISDDTIKNYIKSAQEQLQNYLALRFKKQVYFEKLSFTAEDFYNWGFLRTTYPVVKGMSLEGFLNTTKQSTYPAEWLASKDASDGILYHRNLYIIPAGNSTGVTQAQLFTGIIPNLTYLGLARIPEYWTATYVTGWDKVPMNIIDAVGKLAAINIFRISGDLILSPGISSFSLSIDGLSQSQGIKAFDNRIKMMLDDLTQRILPELRDYYRGFLLGVC